MLPSYSSTLPTGQEKGRYLALDVGGSTLRVALVSLDGRRDAEIVSFKAYKIDQTVKKLVGHCFFDWMAARIVETLEETGALMPEEVVSMALAWSFPIE
jgi:hexokinase